jgi:hypothetical protein
MSGETTQPTGGTGGTQEERQRLFLNGRWILYTDARIPDAGAYKLAQLDLPIWANNGTLPAVNKNWPDKPDNYVGEWPSLYSDSDEKELLISKRNDLIIQGKSLKDAEDGAIAYKRQTTDILVDVSSEKDKAPTGKIKVPTGYRDRNGNALYNIVSCDDVKNDWEWYADNTLQGPSSTLQATYTFCMSNVTTTWGEGAKVDMAGAEAVAEARKAVGDPKCPEGWEAALPRSPEMCVQKCPAPYRFYEMGIGKEENGTLNTNSMCVYPENDKVWVQVNAVPKAKAALAALLRLPNVTYKDLSGMDTDLFDSYRRKTRTFNRDIRAANAKLTEREKVERAFKDMQAKEESRDQDPDAYEAARANYYMLTSGTGWADAERARVARTEVAPVLKSYDDKFAEVDSKYAEYSRVVELINKFRTQVVRGREDLGATLDAVYKHLGNAKSQVNIQKRMAHEQTFVLAEWFDTILNGILVIVILVGCILIAYKYMFKPKTIPTVAVRV